MPYVTPLTLGGKAILREMPGGRVYVNLYHAWALEGEGLVAYTASA